MTELDNASGAGSAPASDDTHTPLPEQGSYSPDESGRSAPAGQEPADGAPQGFVPHQALHAARQEAREAKEANTALQRRLDEMDARFQGFTQAQPRPQPPAPQAPPDAWSQPAEHARWAAQQETQPVVQQNRAQFEAISLAMANNTFGEDTVHAADAALAQYLRQNPHMVPALEARIMRPGTLPHVEAVKWHKEQAALSQYGADPNAFIEAEVARRLAAAGGQAPAHQHQQQPAAPPPMPSSFTGTPSQGPRSAANMGTGPRPLSAIMGR